MIVNYNKIEKTDINNMKGGTGTVTLYKMPTNKECIKNHAKAVIHPGSSIGMHKHENDFELVYILSGKGKLIYQGKEYILEPDMGHLCDKGEMHSIINDSTEDLIAIIYVMSEPNV